MVAALPRCEDCDHTFQAEKKVTPRRIFISYGRDEHAALAARLKQDLMMRGHQVWFDTDRLKVGGDWEQYIEEGLDWVQGDPHGGRVILLMTPHSVRRPDGYCLNEIARALQGRLGIVPVMVVWCEPPLSICRIQWYDMLDCVPFQERQERYETKFERLAVALEEDRLDFEGSQERLLRLLEPLPFDAEISQHLLRFTGRRWLIDRLDAWIADPSAPRVFWIRGEPGTGKTAISAWLCTYRREVAAFHLCRYGHVYKADPRKCVLSIAYQLSSQLPDYQSRLNNLNLEQMVPEANALTLFDTLIVQPLSGSFPPPDRTLVVVIDGLDEATRRDVSHPGLAKNDLASFIASEFARTPSWLRLVITSRPDPEVTHPLQGLTPSTLDAAAPENEQDIREYLARELARGARIPGCPPHVAGTHRGWVGVMGAIPEETIDHIVERSEGVFLYVHWICQEVAQGRLALDRLDEFPQGLGQAYVQFFERQFPDINDYQMRIAPAFDALAAAQEPLELAMIAALFGWDERQQRRFSQSLGSLFETVEGRIQPYHRSIMDWLTDGDRAGPYFVSVRDGHQRLAQFGWRLYLEGVPDLPRYLLAHLPVHMARAERWEELGALLNDGEFLAALEESSYARWHRFESPEWQELLSAWIRHLLSGQESEEARIAIATVYFNAFWWWGEYISFPLCEQISSLLTDACQSCAKDRFLNALRQFDRSYPRKRDYRHRKTAVEDWQQAREALEVLRPSLGCDGDLAELKDNPRLLHLRAITDIYLAEARDALGEPGAEAYYEEAGAIVQEIEDDRWITGWVFYQLGELWTDRGQYEAALGECRKALATAAESDHEVKANIFRVLGDTLWKHGQPDAALEAYKLAVYYAFRLQGEPHPADLYTVTFYGEMMERVLTRIQELKQTDEAAAAVICRPFHDFWNCYWAQAANEGARPDETMLQSWFRENKEENLKAHLFPPVPASGDRQYASMVEAVSAKMVGQIRQLEESLAALSEGSLPLR